jgi:hypothetical protein
LCSSADRAVYRHPDKPSEKRCGGEGRVALKSILPVMNQALFPGAGDVDDCWVVATIWAAKVADPNIDVPDIPTFRAAAQSPNADGVANGGNNDRIVKGVTKLWPHLGVIDFRLNDWDKLMRHVEAGRPVSLGLLAGKLATGHRFGFNGAHQVGVLWDGTRIRVMNPLAVRGSQPHAISETELRPAALALDTSHFRAVVFPAPTQEVDMRLFFTGPSIGQAVMRPQGGLAWSLTGSPRRVQGGMVRNVFGEVTADRTLTKSVPAGKLLLLVSFNDPEPGDRKEAHVIVASDTDWPRGRLAIG